MPTPDQNPYAEFGGSVATMPPTMVTQSNPYAEFGGTLAGGSNVPDYLANDPQFRAMSPAQQQEVIARHARSRSGIQPSPADTTQPGSGDFNDAVQGFTAGVGKGLTELGQFPVKVAQKVGLPTSFAHGTVDLGEVNRQDTEAHGAAETVGKIGENILEFVAGDEALKGLALAEKLKVAERLGKIAESSPKLAKAIDIGLNAVRTGTVGTAQGFVKSGGDVSAAAKEGAATGLGGAALETAGVGLKALPGVAQKVGKVLNPEEINPEELKEPPKPVSTHVKTEIPLDDATIRKSFNKDLSQEARDTLREKVGNTIPPGSSVENTLMKAVAPVNKTVEEQGLALNNVLQSAGEMKTNSATEVTTALEKLKKSFDLEAEKPIRDAIDSEAAKAREVLLSKSPVEVNSYIRELDKGIRDYRAPEGRIETTGDARDAAKVTIRRALRDKLSTEVPATKPINDVLARHLELRGALRTKLGDVAHDSVGANAQHLSELQKGQAHMAWEQKVAGLQKEYQKAADRAKLIKRGLGLAGLSTAGGAVGAEVLRRIVP